MVVQVGGLLLYWFHLGWLPQLRMAVTHTAGSGGDCWLDASVFFSTLLIFQEAEPASSHGDPGSVSETKAEAIRPLEASALEITQRHFSIFCWLKRNDKTSLESRVGRKSPLLAFTALALPVPYRGLRLGQLWFYTLSEQSWELRIRRGIKVSVGLIGLHLER